MFPDSNDNRNNTYLSSFPNHHQFPFQSWYFLIFSTSFFTLLSNGHATSIIMQSRFILSCATISGLLYSISWSVLLLLLLSNIAAHFPKEVARGLGLQKQPVNKTAADRETMYLLGYSWGYFKFYH